MSEADETLPIEEMPVWTYAQTACLICGHREVSVYPITAERLECGGCGAMNPAPDLPEERTP